MPTSLLTEELLNVRNYERVAVGRIAFERGFIDQIPPQFRPKSGGPLKRLAEKLGVSRPPFA